METLINALLLLLIILLLVIGLNYGINKSINNQSIMLCKSALKSGNKDYLNNCSCYYEGEKISCINK